jgi:PTH1 family peptidyl-tRNA hydrolase
LLVVFGLGNPGDRYDHTRHNVGTEVITGLIRKLGLPIKAGRGEFVYARDPALDLGLVVPTTYVNLSGLSASEALGFFGVDRRSLLAVCDDFSLPLGAVRIRKKGSDGGHNGLASIIYQVASQDFPRLRIGIGPVPPDTDPADFVLSRFRDDERAVVERLKQEAADALLAVAASGLEHAMNIYNRRVDT